jgi:hypothetical protein
MLFAASFAPIMRAMCTARILLGVISSLTRDSAYVDGPEMYKNTVEGGTARSKRPGSLRIMVGDVQSGKEGADKTMFAPASSGKLLI